MRKLLFILLCIPFVASVGHDIYLYQQEPEKGIRLTDVGALWDKYHKESHDQWKNKIQELGKTIEEMTPEILTTSKEVKAPVQKVATDVQTNAPSYAESFKQSISRDGDVKVSEIDPEDLTKAQTNFVQEKIGFILEQKAILVSLALPIIAFLLNALLSPLFKEKEEMDKIQSLKKKRKKVMKYKR